MHVDLSDRFSCDGYSNSVVSSDFDFFFFVFFFFFFFFSSD